MKTSKPLWILLALLMQGLSILANDIITNVMSPIVSYQYPNNLSTEALTNGGLMSPIASYQYFEWAGDSVLHLLSSPQVSYLYPEMIGAIQSSVVLSSTSVAADGKSSATVTVTLWDSDGNPVVGKTIQITAVERQASGLLTTISSVTQPVGPTDFSGQTTATLTSVAPGNAIISAVDITDSIPLPQQPNLQFTSALVKPNSDLSQAITMFSQIVGQNLNDPGTSISLIGLDAGSYGDQFHSAFDQDKAEGALDAILGIAGMFSAGKDTVKAAELLALPGVEETGVGALIKDSPLVSYLFDTELMQGDLSERVLKSALNKAAEVAGYDIVTYSLSEALGFIASHPSGLSSIAKGNAQDCLLLQTSLQQHAQTLNTTGIPALTAAQQTAWATDLQARYGFSAAMLGVLAHENNFLHQYMAARQQQQSVQNKLELLGAQIAIEATATILFDGIGALIAGGALTLAGEQSTLKNMNADQLGYDAAFSDVAGCIQYATQIYLNASSAYTEISQGQTANPVTGQIGQFWDFEQGYQSSGPLNLWSRFAVTKAYSTLDIKNTSVDQAVFSIFVLYGYSASPFGLTMPNLSQVNFATAVVPAGTQTQMPITYYDGSNGCKPDPSTPMTVYVLGSNKSGTFYIGSLNHSWNPALTPAASLMGLTGTQSSRRQPQGATNGPEIQNPVACYVTQNPTNQAYLARVFVTNPFDQPYSIIVTQALPGGVTVLQTDGNLNTSSIVWTNALAGHDVAKATFSFTLSLTPGAQTNLPPPTAVFLDPTNNSSSLLISSVPGFSGSFPVQVNGNIPVGVLASNVAMQVAITNITATNQTGFVQIALTNSTSGFSTNFQQSFVLPASQNTDLTFVLPNTLPPGQHVLSALLNINGGVRKFLSGVYTVPLPPLILAVNPITPWTTNGLNLILQGPVGSNYLIEASTDLRNWTPIRYFTSTNAVHYLDEASAMNYPFQFFRAVMP